MSTADRPLISARHLVKRFGDFTAVKGIDVDVYPGESFGFLGPNGAGKSSTMRMIGCVSPATEGSLSIFGLDAATHGKEIRSRMGVVPQEDQLDEQLSVENNLIIYGRYFDLPRAECKRRAAELLDFVQLADRAKSLIEPLSGGMKRRVTIARSLINEPELLLLDEPTTGLDPQARHVLWDRLYRLKQRGITLVLTTHYMDEAEQLCDRLVVMDQGQIVAMGSPLELIREHSSREVLELRYAAGTNEARAADVDGIGSRQEVLPDRVLIYADDGEDALNEVHRRGSAPESALVRRGTRRNRLRHDSRLDLLSGVLGNHGRDGDDPVVVGVAVGADLRPHRLCLQRCGDDGHHVHAVVVRLRIRAHHQPAAVPVFGHLLSGVELRRLGMGAAAQSAVSRGYVGARCQPGRFRMVVPRPRRRAGGAGGLRLDRHRKTPRKDAPALEFRAAVGYVAFSGAIRPESRHTLRRGQICRDFRRHSPRIATHLVPFS